MFFFRKTPVFLVTPWWPPNPLQTSLIFLQLKFPLTLINFVFFLAEFLDSLVRSLHQSCTLHLCVLLQSCVVHINYFCEFFKKEYEQQDWLQVIGIVFLFKLTKKPQATFYVISNLVLSYFFGVRVFLMFASSFLQKNFNFFHDLLS